MSRLTQTIDGHVDFCSADTIYKNIIGGNHSLQGPFGSKPIIYADSTASGKGLQFIEDYLQQVVLPYYANTHTEASATGLQTSRFREAARDAICEALHAPSSEYAVVFTGSGCTGAIDKLARVFGISPLSPAIEDASKRPVVFIGPYEHHSNELIWRESPVDCVVIPDRQDTGYINLDILQEELRLYHDRPLKIGSFSAASNVTGIRSDTSKITNILHEHGALACWDFAAAAPHVRMDMQGQDIDAAYISPHKFVGGPGTPGLLVARKSLFKNEVPTVPGGGTVDYVQPHSHAYVKDVEHREEGGTPAIMESIRAGLVLQLHAQVGPDWIERTETEYLGRAVNAWRNNPNIVVLGNPYATNRVSIVSFLIKAKKPSSEKSTVATARSNSNAPDLLLHHNFVVAVLNDLFGIQSRGGCSCAGPYGHILLHIDQKQSDRIMNEIKHSGDTVKRGWTRVSFSYYFPPETVDYIIDAVDLVAREGYKLLPWYELNSATSMWTHVNANQQPMDLWDFSKGNYEKPSVLHKRDLSATMKQAHKVFASLKHQRAPSIVKKNLPDVPDDLRWYLIQEEAQRMRERDYSIAVNLTSGKNQSLCGDVRNDGANCLDPKLDFSASRGEENRETGNVLCSSRLLSRVCTFVRSLSKVRRRRR